MKCPDCGADVPDDVAVCQVCGGRIETDTWASGPVEDQADSGAAAASAEQQPPATAPTPPEPASEAPQEPATARQLVTGTGGPQQTEQQKETLWEGRYSLRDMNVIWIYTALITAMFLIFGVWMAVRGLPDWLPALVFWGLILLVPVVLWVYQLGRALHRSTIRYRLTPHRLYYREGIFVRRQEALELVSIEDIGTTQSLVERLVCGGVGKIQVHSKDPGDPNLVLRGLRDYDEAFHAIDKARREERERRGIALI